MAVMDGAIKSLKKIYHVTRDGWSDAVARHYLRKVQRKKKDHDVIRVGFIVQMPEVWDKEVDVYNEMVQREDFNTMLLVVPPYDFVSECVSTDYTNNNFLQQYPDAICAVQENGDTIDVAALNLDYVFYQRPYDHYLPKPLRSSSLVKITRCCEIPYGYTETEMGLAVTKDQAFLRNIYFQFESSRFTRDFLYRRYRTECEAGLKHIEYLGYPVLDRFLKMRVREGGVKTVLWTPRWSYDSVVGGSHFFEYKDFFLSVAKDNPQIKFIFRPHPLMFDEFKKKGLMTEYDIEIFMKSLKENRIEIDGGGTIEDAISKADLLITDLSSIMIQYFLTGRPMIYCKCDKDFIGFAAEMEQCSYVVESEGQLTAVFSEIVGGHDPLERKRRSLIEREFDTTGCSAKKIVDCIRSDYMEV